MKKSILIFFILISLLSHKSFSQSITCSQLFADSTIPHFSMGGNKMGWVTRNGNHYQHHYMDTLLNITTFQDTNLTYRALNTGTGFFTGNYFCGSTMDKNGNLIGLFFDDECFSDSLQSMTAGPYPGFICHYWYNYATQQKTYFSFTNLAAQFFPLLSPDPQTPTYNYKIIWSGDTLILKSGFYTTVYPMGVCLKFLNFNLVEGGSTASSEGNVLKCFTDWDHKINTLYENDLITSDGVNYNYQPIPINPGLIFFSDALKDSIGNIYIKYSDSLRIMSNSNDTTVSAPNTGGYNMQTLCVDHLNRLWMISDDTASFYTNNTWTSFPLNFNNFENYTSQIAAWHSIFFEYAPNKFVMSWATDIGIQGGNGLIFFTFNDSSTVTTAKLLNIKNEIHIYPNPVSTILVIDNLPNGLINIKDIIGNDVISSLITNSKMNINVSELSNGIYFVYVNNEEVKKIVINR
jgi:hypothetical protein